jgi:hypothetical protein
MLSSWGPAHKQPVDAALARLKSLSSSKQQQQQQPAKNKVVDAAPLPPARRNSEPDAAAAFQAAAEDSAVNDNRAVAKLKQIKPQPPPGSKIQVTDTTCA